MSKAATITARVPLAVRRRPGRKTIVMPEGSVTPALPRTHADPALKALARAHRWEGMLDEGRDASISELAAAERIDRGYLGRILQLTLFASDIVWAILDGRRPQDRGLPAPMQPLLSGTRRDADGSSGSFGCRRALTRSPPHAPAPCSAPFGPQQMTRPLRLQPRYGGLLVVAALSLLAIVPGPAAARDRPPLRVAVALTLSGPSGNIGAEVLQGVRMALEEAGPQAAGVELAVTDDGGGAEGAREAARRVVAGDALAVIGPSLSTVALAVEPIYAEAGLAAVAPTVATDEATGLFRLNLGQSRVGEALADYLHHTLAGRRAAVIHSDDGFGRPFAQGFRRGADRLGIAASFHPVSGPEQAAAAARRIAGIPGSPAVVLGLLETTAVPALKVLRRADVPGPFLGTASFAYGGYARLFAEEPEERAAPGFFTDGLYAASPVLFDSGGAALLAFEERFRARHDGREPSWRVVLAYDATRLLLGAIISALPTSGAPSAIPERRRTVREAIAALDGPARAFAGLSGPVWFDAARGRPAAVRMARFGRDRPES
ncbi:MAG: ABC transporter substrate-binding protein, partial [Acetobacteraceae bacterium]|nr:ABC transporter substrate-binding protein [Acetobacteraceae bacterium]